MAGDDFFWSVDRLLPKRSQRMESVEISKLRQMTSEENAPFVERSFSGSAVMVSVKIYKGICSVTGESFLKRARRTRELKPRGGKAHYSFFSYSPDYDRLDGAQLESYLAFRASAESGQYQKTDYSYFLLYVYELLNLGDELDTAKSLELLIWLWKSYRGDFAVIDRLFCDWVFDFCMEWGLELPYEELDGILPHLGFQRPPVIFNSYIFDWVLKKGGLDGAVAADTVTKNLCDYRFDSVRVYRENGLYRSALDGFLAKLFSVGFLREGGTKEEFLSIKIPTSVKMKRYLYNNATVSPERKRFITVDYLPLAGDINVKGRYSSLIKYIDNCVRKKVGVRGRFLGVDISKTHKDFIDRCFEEYFGSSSYEAVKRELSSETRAEPRVLRVDMEKARTIEDRSWENTRLLTKDVDDAGQTVEIGKLDPKAEKTSEEPKEALYEASDSLEDITELCASLDKVELGFTVALLYQSKAEAAEYAKKRGQLFDSLLRRVNNKANSTVGDVILSPDGAVIEDYREELEFILPEDQYRSE